MKKTAFLFSGQGSQYNGMSLDFVEIKEVREIFNTGSEIIGWDIAEAIRQKSKEELSQTLTAQPAVFAASLASLAAAKEAGLTAEAVAGHSLGEYAAMVASGILSVSEGFRAIRIRCEAMERAAKKNPGTMAAVMGIDSEKIIEICAQVSAGGDYVTAVNFNSPIQTVIAGTESGLQNASVKLKDAGAKRVIKLAVSAAFHSELMREAGEEVEAGFKSIAFSPPKLDFYSNVTGDKYEEFSDMPGYLGRHIYSPVKFTAEISSLIRNGYNTFIELGPDKILTGLVKKINNEVIAVNIENTETLTAAKELLLC